MVERLAATLKGKLRDRLMGARPELGLLMLMLRKGEARSTEKVRDEYSEWWERMRRYLDAASSLDGWLTISGHDDRAVYRRVEGKVRSCRFDAYQYYREVLGDALAEHFPTFRSVTEYGCGVGRNLLALKRRFPHVACYGYELCEPGVEIARAAAKKFGVEVEYAKLDYVKGAAEDYVFPASDVAFTVCSLEQLPETNAIGLRNIHQRVKLGSVHIEPVRENYPIDYWGVLGRLYHSRLDYLRDFDRNARALGASRVQHTLLATSHSALTSQSLYVLER